MTLSWLVTKTLSCGGVTVTDCNVSFQKASNLLMEPKECLQILSSWMGSGGVTSLASCTLRRERKDIVTLQPSSCRHGRNLIAVTNEIRTLHRLYLLSWSSRYSGCQYLIIQPHCLIIAFLSDNALAVVWPDPSSLRRVWLARLGVWPGTQTLHPFFLGLCYLQLLVCKYGEKGEGLNNLVTCVVISCQIDTHGAVPDEESQGPSFLVMSCRRTGNQNNCKGPSIQLFVWYTRDWWAQSLWIRIVTVGHLPSCVYRLFTWCDKTSQAFPLCIQMLEVVKC